jgi:hypothetical protein
LTLTAQFAPGPLSADELNTSSIPVVTTTADIIAPFLNQLIINSTDNMLYRYNGTAWVACVALGGTTSAQLHEIRYEQKTSGQSVPTSTDTKMKFETVWNSCDDVVVSGTNNTDFLLTRAGLYVVSVGARYLGNAGSGERHLHLQFGTTFAVANRVVFDSDVNVGSAPVSVSAATVERFAANTSVFVGLWQNAGTAITLDTGFGGSNHIGLAWLRP